MKRFWWLLGVMALCLLVVVSAGAECPSPDAEANDGQHLWSRAEVSQPTCTEPGFVLDVCIYCGETRFTEEAALGHLWGAWVDGAAAANCTEGGAAYRTCGRCGNEERTETAPLGHDWGDWTEETPAGCTTGGTESRRCLRCSETDHRDTAPAGHAWGEWQVLRAAGCTISGLEGRVCARCSTIDTREVDALGHAPGDWEPVTPADCVTAGVEAVRCTRCAEQLNSRAVPALGHSWSDWTQRTAATCTEAGEEMRVCARCETEESLPLPALGHTEGEWRMTVEPGCETIGEETLICGRCYQAIETREMEPIGHDWMDWLETRPPTCVEEGVETRRCARCGAAEARSLSALGHRPGDWQTVTEPACEEVGAEAQICLVCGENVESRELPALGHEWGNWWTLTPGTCVRQEVERRSCARCDAYEERTTGYQPHTWGEWETIQLAAVGVAGEERRVCAVCGMVQTRELPPLEAPEQEAVYALTLTHTDLGQVADGVERLCSLRVTNSGSVPVEFHCVETREGYRAEDWHMLSFTAVDSVLAPGESRSFDYSFTPDAAHVTPGTADETSYGVDEAEFIVRGYAPDSGEEVCVSNTAWRSYAVPRVEEVQGSLTLTVEVLTEPKNGTGYQAGEDILLRLSVENLTDSTYSAVTLASPVSGMVRRYATLEAGGTDSLEVTFTPDGLDEALGRIRLLWTVTGTDASGRRRVVVSNPIEMFIGEEKPAAEAAQTGVITLADDAACMLACDDDAGTFATHLCALHQTPAQALTEAQAAPEVERLQALEAARALWADALDAQYTAMAESADAAGLAALLTERAAFGRQLETLEASIRLTMDAEKTAEIVTLVLARQAITLCAARQLQTEAVHPDEPWQALLHGRRDADFCELQLAGYENGEVTHTQAVCAVHAAVAAQTHSLLAERELTPADRWAAIAALWQDSLHSLVHTRYRTADAEGRALIAADAAACTAWFEAHEALLQSLCPDHPERVAEALAWAAQSRLTALCQVP